MNCQSFRYNQQDTKDGKHETSCLSSPEKKLSLGSLVTWNITKVLEAYPYIDLKSALRSTQDQMERESRDGAPMMCLMPEEQHLAAALLAWHRLGHERADSLHEFVKSSLNEYRVVESVSSVKVVSHSVSKIRSCFTSSSSFDVNSITGPVVRLPLQTKVVMRVENNYLFDKKFSKTKQKSKKDKCDPEDKPKRIKAEVKKEIKAACTDFGIDKEHLPKLAELEEIISDLRTRAANLSRRKTERLELLERTDVAWKDLEHGYERRLKLAEDKAKDTEDQIKRILEERNDYKAKCKTLVDDLKRRSAEAETVREKLTQVDKEVCGLACERLRLSELVTQDDAALAAEHCRLTQIDRELEFKEQAERRNIQYLESEIGTARGLTIEAERATRSDMAGVQENLKQIRNEIKKEENKNTPLKAEIANLQKQKASLTCDLDSFKIKCDDDMLRKIDILKSKKSELARLQEKIIDCQCKLPIDASIEAKRTPSLAANWSCETDGNPKSCSCTSIRHQLMSDLLGGLFKGLMTDLSATGSLMPCQLLKCLDENHDWERDSILRTNIHSYCSQLFTGELNIAIATTIENNRMKWLRSVPVDKEKTGVTQHDPDARTRSLAAELMEQMLKRKSEALQISSRVQPCQCRKESKRADAVFPLFVKPQTTRKINDSSNLKKTINDVAQLRQQVEILKKETIGKDDLKVMEDKLTKIIQRASRSKSKSKNKNRQFLQTHNINYDDKPEKDENFKHASKEDTIVLEELDYVDVKNKFSSKPKAICVKQKTNKKLKNIELPPAVGVYICDTQQVSNNTTKYVFRQSPLHKGHKSDILGVGAKKCTCAYKSSYLGDKNNTLIKEQAQNSCPKECICINKIPSNTSINEFLDSLTKTESYNENLKISPDTKETNEYDRKCFLNKEAWPTISKYMCAINLNMANENFCNIELLNSNISGSPKSNINNTSYRSETILSLEKSEFNSSGGNNDEVKNGLNRHIMANEYGTPIKDSEDFKESKNAIISAVASTPQSCVCCNDFNSNADEIEINALNLLKEHIKDKIRDLKPSLKHSISVDEEKIIYKNILKEIKNIVTDDTFEVLCKCSFKNHEGSRQRAYNLLKEYLKIKIKKVQCSCTKEYDHSEKLLPTILDKITELIENDFERLKIKYQEKCVNKKIIEGLKIKGSVSEKIDMNKDQSVLINKLGQKDSAYEQRKNQNDIENIMSAEVSHNSQNQSIDSELYGEPKTLNIDKKLSCLLNPDIYLNTNQINEYAGTFNLQSKSERDNKSAQVSFFFNSQNKSADAIQHFENNTIDRNISCTLGNDVYVTDCKCRKNFESNFEETTRSDTRVLYFDINDNFFGLN
ncbi:uncharacterized protein LOC121729537 [Aricia agestis]|uniref:uncharacterized protein LOC121729537 n=1 Tax=Aricia agestis TaxID=91739 RepID=UPI001C20A12E|nr:uncharacterized protein LOC121729537 [Aricia agestis]